jgi:hypothetical protein
MKTRRRIERMHQDNVFDDNIPVTDEFNKPVFYALKKSVEDARSMHHKIHVLRQVPTCESMHWIPGFIRNACLKPGYFKDMFRVEFQIPIHPCSKRVLFPGEYHPGPGVQEDQQIRKQCPYIQKSVYSVSVVVDICGYSYKQVEACLPYMKGWLYFIMNEATHYCRKGLRIVLWLSEFKRKRSEGYVNGGLTTRCDGGPGEILVYRKEEWFRVFMHETIHRYGHDVEIGMEGYVEYWSERLIVMIYIMKEGKGIGDYNKKWKNEKMNTRRKMRMIKETRMDPKADIEEYFTRKGRMMGIKEPSTKEEIKDIKDLRMAHTEVTF